MPILRAAFHEDDAFLSPQREVNAGLHEARLKPACHDASSFTFESRRRLFSS